MTKMEGGAGERVLNSRRLPNIQIDEIIFIIITCVNCISERMLSEVKEEKKTTVKKEKTADGDEVELGTALPATSNKEIGGISSHALTTKERRPLNENRTGSGLFHSLSRDYVIINSAMIRGLTHAYRTHPIVRMASETMIGQILSGTIRIEGVKGGGDSSYSMDAQIGLWMQFARDVIHQQYILGFAAVTYAEDEVHGWVPRVMELSYGIEVRYRINRMGEPMFGFYDLSLFGGLGRNVPLPNIWVMVHTPPTPDGQLCSCMASLLPSIMELQQLASLHLLAVRSRAQPAVVTEYAHIEPGKGGQNLGNAEITKVDEERVRMLSHITNLLNTTCPNARPASIWAAIDEIASRKAMEAGPRIDLERNRVLTKQVMAEEPTNFIKYELLLQQKILMGFGVPPNHIQAESTHGKMSQINPQNSLMKDHANAVKNRLSGYLTDMWRIIWTRPIAEGIIIRSPTVSKSFINNLNSTFRITIPGLPLEETYRELYREGTLKWEAYKTFVSAQHAIPQDCFEETPQPPRPEIPEEKKIKKPLASQSNKKRPRGT